MKPPVPRPVEMLASEHARRVSVDCHAAFRASLAPKPLDEFDDELDDEIQVDPYAGDPPSRRSDKAISRILAVLDSLENSNAERGPL
jgi:hypothetical protein